jgi:hypothetical protein
MEDTMRAKKFALGFGVAIILPMMIHYGVSTFVKQPKCEDFQVPHYYERHQSAAPKEKLKLETEQDVLQAQFKKETAHFQKYLFFAAVPLGIAAIIFGAFIPIQSVGTGLLCGGIFCICDGYLNYWTELTDVLKFISLVIAFIVLLIVGYNKLDRK